MNTILQTIVGILFFGIASLVQKRSLSGFLLLITVPFLCYYQFSFVNLLFSFALAILLKCLSKKDPKSRYLLFFILAIILCLFISGHKIYENIAIENVTNSQRGEHPNFQTNIAAKLLHNKSTALMYYLGNLNDRLSVSTVFASGLYPNFSKYLPIAFLFPWYLPAFLIALRSRYKEYLNVKFIIAISLLYLLSSILAIGSADAFIFSIVLFLCFESVDMIEKAPKPLIVSTIILNLLYLCLFLFPINLMWNI